LVISSRTPEGLPNRCPLCGAVNAIEPSNPPGDAPCPNCGHLLWFFRQDEGDIKVLRLNCRTLGPIPREALADALDAEAGTQVVLDFDGVESISSEALAALLKMGEFAKVQGAFERLRLRNVHPDIAEVFRITRLDQVFQISSHQNDP
jgi:anti-anti-sigma factor